ncbi:hypothetical protein DAPPUDRAFT_251954 [Daphnia pulex]|uniref:Uncharacterized protein n=1 Tax=Daphnia pulex TaxID=6669 RepID=E9H1B4_DAPPU|nr:hypothetical protein DAPPUDRAFT_251954 [Daphnia pulex]|eukprot:EFX74416.1 hypothetical protein DAPPUDRAFT_251954 [Daphnia pulex]
MSWRQVSEVCVWGLSVVIIYESTKVYEFVVKNYAFAMHNWNLTPPALRSSSTSVAPTPVSVPFAPIVEPSTISSSFDGMTRVSFPTSALANEHIDPAERSQPL